MISFSLMLNATEVCDKHIPRSVWTDAWNLLPNLHVYPTLLLYLPFHLVGYINLLMIIRNAGCDMWNVEFQCQMRMLMPNANVNTNKPLEAVYSYSVQCHITIEYLVSCHCFSISMCIRIWHYHSHSNFAFACQANTRGYTGCLKIKGCETLKRGA